MSIHILLCYEFCGGQHIPGSLKMPHCSDILEVQKRTIANTLRQESGGIATKCVRYKSDAVHQFCVIHFTSITFGYFTKYHCMVIHKEWLTGVPGWLSRLSVRPQLSSWSHGLWVHTPRQALCWQLRACSQLQILSLTLSLPLPHLCSVSLSLK